MSTRPESLLSRSGAEHAGTRTLRVWDPIVRLFHWSVVIGCAVNLLHDEGDQLHKTIGYAVAAAVGIRILWGFFGPGHARFSAFVPRPGMLLDYVQRLLHGREPRYLGHNPAGAVMMVALIGLLVAVSTTGWMMGLDRFWGDEVLEELHEGFANAILLLAALHVFAAIFESIRHRENLVASMITGRKRRASGTDVDRCA